MNVTRTIIVGLLLILSVVTSQPLSCAVHFAVNKGCGATYYPGEMIIFSYRIDGSPGDDIKVTLKVELPDGTVNTIFSNKTISPNIQYFATGIIGSQFGTRKAILEYTVITGSPPMGITSMRACEYEVASGGVTATTLRIDSNVSGFQVWLDGVYNHTTPYNYTILQNISAGTHVVTLIKAGCTPATKTVNIVPNTVNEITINMSCGPGGGEEAPDIDGDGVPDDQDGCYNPECTIVDNKGCPKDSDRDGVNECDDRCPEEKGSPDKKGCPEKEREKEKKDRDNDGVLDDQDECYNPECTVVDSKGCPKDSDGDKINDCKDECPRKSGEPRNKGCPLEDSDSDGVIDDQDNCHNPGCSVVDSEGCPLDSDNDGINDCEDNCPHQSGPRSNNGCEESEQGPQFCLGTGLIVVLIVLGGINRMK